MEGKNGIAEVLQIDPLWAAKGDLAVATANNAADVLSVGSTGQLLTVTSATPAWTSIGNMVVASTDATAAQKAMALASGGAVCDGTADQTEINAALGTASVNVVMLVGTTFTVSAAIVIPDGKLLTAYGVTIKPSAAAVGCVSMTWLGGLHGATFNTISLSSTYSGTLLTILGKWDFSDWDHLIIYPQQGLRDLTFLHGFNSSNICTGECILLQANSTLESQCIGYIIAQNIHMYGYYQKGFHFKCIAGDNTYGQPWINDNQFIGGVIFGVKYPFYFETDETLLTGLNGYCAISENKFTNYMIDMTDENIGAVITMGANPISLSQSFNLFNIIVMDWVAANGKMIDISSDNSGNRIELCSNFDVVGKCSYTGWDEEDYLDTGNTIINQYNSTVLDPHRCNYQTITVGEKVAAWETVYKKAADGLWWLADASAVATTRGKLLLCPTAIGGGTCTNGTGTIAAGASPVTLALGANVITISQAGTFTVVLNGEGTCVKGTVDSVSPAVLHTGSNTVTVADASNDGTFTITPTSIGVGVKEGYVYNAAWTWDMSKDIFLSETPGAITQTAPSDAGDQIRCVANPIYADSLDWVGGVDLTYGEI